MKWNHSLRYGLSASILAWIRLTLAVQWGLILTDSSALKFTHLPLTNQNFNLQIVQQFNTGGVFCLLGFFLSSLFFGNVQYCYLDRKEILIVLSTPSSELANCYIPSTSADRVCLFFVAFVLLPHFLSMLLSTVCLKWVSSSILMLFSYFSLVPYPTLKQCCFKITVILSSFHLIKNLQRKILTPSLSNC